MPLSMDRFVGKVAVVTGASAGIGVGIVEQLVKEGVIVAGLARRVERVQKIAEQLKGEKGKLYAFKCDITKEEDIVSTFKRVVNELGNVHILVNNAGMMKVEDLISGTAEKWKVTLDTNVVGLCIATREAVQNMLANNIDGHIIHINSTIGHPGDDFPGSNVYGPSKFAVTSLAETLRREFNRKQLKIKITSISPGYVETEFHEAAGIPTEIRPPIYPLDLADAVIYTLSTPPHVNVKEVILQAVGS